MGLGLIARRATLLAAGSAISGGTYLYSTDPGFRRSTIFWVNTFPIYCHYRFTQWRVKDWPEEEQDEAFERLHDRYSPEMHRIILTLRGFYIKVGQIGATRKDFVPKQYLRYLETLQDQVPAESGEYVKSVVEESLGRPVAEVFSSFEETNIGAASIGQVHRATLHDGQQVVVKVKYPGVEDVFDSDMSTIEAFCKLAQPEQVPFLQEIKKQFMTEFDYRKEAEHLQIVANNIEPHYSRYIRIPHPVMELCTRDVLVMDYLPGKKLVDAVREQYSKLAASKGLSLEELEKAHQQALENGTAVPGPPAWQLDLYISCIRAYDTLRLCCYGVYNNTLGLLFGKHPFTHTPVPLNVPRILNMLLDVHAHQIFVDGVFNGDPHPGNILILDDGRLGLIDFGQVKQLNSDERAMLARLIVALAEDDSEAVVRIHSEMGFRTQRGDPKVSEKIATIGFDRCDLGTTEGQNLQQYFEHLGKVDPVVKGADQYVMASRVSLLLRGLAMHLSYPLRTAVAWKDQAKDYLHSYDVKTKSSTSVGSSSSSSTSTPTASS